MKVKELIEKLNKCDKEKEVVIRFAVVDYDEIGYVLFPEIVNEYYDQITIYSNYPCTAEDCDFIGQVDLVKAYKNESPDMTSDEMLEKLGYTEKTKTQAGRVKYKKDDDNVLYFSPKERKFNKSGEHDDMCDCITMDELKAVYQKCKELGWLE